MPNPSKTSLALDWAGLKNGDAWVALVTFLYLDFLDATGTLFTMARLVNENVPGEGRDFMKLTQGVFLCVGGGEGARGNFPSRGGVLGQSQARHKTLSSRVMGRR